MNMKLNSFLSLSDDSDIILDFSVFDVRSRPKVSRSGIMKVGNSGRKVKEHGMCKCLPSGQRHLRVRVETRAGLKVGVNSLSSNPRHRSNVRKKQRKYFPSHFGDFYQVRQTDCLQIPF